MCRKRQGGGANSTGVVAKLGQTISALCDIISRRTEEYTDRSLTQSIVWRNLFSTQITSSLSPAHQTSLRASRRSDSHSATSAAAVGARAADRPVMNLRPAPVNNKHAWLLAVSADARREQRPDLYCYAF